MFLIIPNDTGNGMVLTRSPIDQPYGPNSRLRNKAYSKTMASVSSRRMRPMARLDARGGGNAMRRRHQPSGLVISFRGLRRLYATVYLVDNSFERAFR